MNDIQVVIYRDKYTGEIKNWHEMRESITQEIVDNYNSGDHETTAEIVTLEEKSVAHYFYTLKVAAIQDFRNSFQDIAETLNDLSSRLDDKIYECEKLIEQEGGDNDID